MSESTRQGRLSTIDGKESLCTAQWLELSDSQRIKRSFQYLFSFWAAALACVLIPILHFVLVPGLFIAGLVMAQKTWKQKVLLRHLQASCPNCLKPLDFKNDRVYQGPVKELCRECHSSFEIQFTS